jgi:hypothetical protein
MAIEAKRWTTNRVLVIAGVLALAGIGVYLLLKLVQADEPPIRVRKGSIELQTCDTSAWQDDGTDWFPGGIGQNRLFVHFTSDTTDPEECQNGVLEGTGVNIRYSNGHVVRIRAAGAKTRIVKGDLAKHPSKNDVLLYTAQPNDSTYFIDQIQVTGGPGGTKRCEFTSATALTKALICSRPGACPCNLP